MSLGDFCDEGTPGNISNPEVKVVSADGTWGAAPWESRSLPRDFSFIKYAATSAAFLFKFLLRPCERRQARGSPPSSFHFPSFAGISGMAFLPVRSLDRCQIREAMFKAS